MAANVKGIIKEMILKYARREKRIFELNLTNQDIPTCDFCNYVTLNLNNNLTLIDNPEMKFNGEFIDNEISMCIGNIVGNVTRISVLVYVIKHFPNYGKILKLKWERDNIDQYFVENYNEFFTDVEKVLNDEPLTEIQNLEIYELLSMKMEILEEITENNFVKVSSTFTCDSRNMYVDIKYLKERVSKYLTPEEVDRFNNIEQFFTNEIENFPNFVIRKTEESDLLANAYGLNEEDSIMINGYLSEIRNMVDIAIYMIRTENNGNPVLK